MRRSLILVLLLVVPVATAAAAGTPFKPGGTYTGTTDQGKSCQPGTSSTCKVKAKISADGTKLSKFKIEWSADCGGRTFRQSTVFQDFDLPGSHFSIKGPYQEKAFHGLTGHHQVVLKGDFTGFGGHFTASGTFKDVIKVNSPASTEHYTCRTGKVHWTAAV